MDRKQTGGTSPRGPGLSRLGPHTIVPLVTPRVLIYEVMEDFYHQQESRHVADALELRHYRSLLSCCAAVYAWVEGFPIHKSHTRVYTYIYIHIDLSICMCTYMYNYTHVYINIHVNIVL